MEWAFYVTLLVGAVVATQRAHIVLPADLIKEIDEAVGPRGRSAFIAETTRAELRKRRLLAYLRSEKPMMKDEDHPEWPNGDSAAWVRSLRDQESERTRSIAAAFAKPEEGDPAR